MKSDVEVVLANDIKKLWMRFQPIEGPVDAILINDGTLPFLLSVFKHKDEELCRKIHLLNNINCMLVHRDGEYHILEAKDVSWLFYKVCK